jgi:hypothetical protein
MGYFDALANASFKTTADGQLLFYPYGSLGRGYIIPTKAEFDKLRRTYKYIWIVTLLLIIIAVWISLFVTSISFPFIVLPVLLAFVIAYMVWARLQCQTLALSSEKLTYGESISNETRGLSSGFLWVFEILSILLILYGLVLLIADPSQWLLALGLIVVFAACAYLWARMILIKKRQAKLINK